MQKKPDIRQASIRVGFDQRSRGPRHVRINLLTAVFRRDGVFFQHLRREVRPTRLDRRPGLEQARRVALAAPLIKAVPDAFQLCPNIGVKNRELRKIVERRLPGRDLFAKPDQVALHFQSGDLLRFLILQGAGAVLLRLVKLGLRAGLLRLRKLHIHFLRAALLPREQALPEPVNRAWGVDHVINRLNHQNPHDPKSFASAGMPPLAPANWPSIPLTSPNMFDVA